MIAQQREAALLKNDAQYNITKLREWVINNNRISLSMDTVYINDVATSSLEQIATDSSPVNARIQGGYDSMHINYGSYAEPNLIRIASQQLKKNLTGEFRVWNPLFNNTPSPPAVVMFMIVYNEGRERILCRMLARENQKLLEGRN